MKVLRSYSMILAVLFFSLQLQSQNLVSEAVVEPGWYRVEYLKFNPGKAEAAKDIIRNYFVEASRLAGIPVPVIELELWSNEYDYMVLWEMPDEGEAYSWQEMPTNNQWYRALIAVAGDEDNAKMIIEQFDTCVSTGKTETARKD